MAGREIVTSIASIETALAGKTTGETLRLTLSRGKHVGTVTLRLAADGVKAPVTPPGDEVLLLGMMLIKGKDGKAAVASVSAASPAAKAGIREGDAIIEIGGLKPTTFKELADAARKLLAGDKRDTLKVTVGRDGELSEKLIVLTPAAKPAPATGPQSQLWRLRGVAQAAVVHIDRLDRVNKAVVKTGIGRADLISHLEETQFRMQLSGLPVGHYVVALHTHGDLGRIGGAAVIQPGVAPASGAGPGQGTGAGPGLDPNIRPGLPATTPGAAPVNGKPVAPAASIPPRAGAARQQTMMVLGAIAVAADGVASLEQRFDGDIESVVGFVIVIHPVSQEVFTRFRPGATLDAKLFQSPLAAGVVGYAIGSGNSNDVRDANRDIDVAPVRP